MPISPDFSSRLQTPEEAASSSAITMFGYGASGTGKTFFAGTIGSDGLIISVGDGHNTLASPTFQNLIKNPPKIIKVKETYNKETGIFDSAQAFDEVSDIMDWAIDSGKFKTICVDEMTALQKVARNKALEVNLASGKSQSLSTSKRYGYILAAIQDYGAEMSMIEQFIATYTSVCNAKMINLILLGHERYVFKKLGDKIGDPEVLDKIRLGITGKTFPDTIPNAFDLVWRFEVLDANPKPIFRARTVGNDSLIAKTRWGGLFEQYVKSPNFLEIEAKVKAHLALTQTAKG